MAAAVRQLKRAEEVTQVFNKLQLLRQGPRSQGLTSILIPSGEGWDRITDPLEMEEQLYHRNKTHFGQLEGTPFTMTPLRQNLDFAASTHVADTVLQGTFDTTNLCHISTEILQAMKQKCDRHLPAAITDDQLRGKLLAWNEGTSTSPSGIHLGHYCALVVKVALLEDTDEGRLFYQKQQYLFNLLLDIINVALINGYALNRWRHATNVMLEKDKGVPKLHRLRVIHLFEANYNLILGEKWKERNCFTRSTYEV